MKVHTTGYNIEPMTLRRCKPKH